jgi:hypothetical protein
MKLLAFASLLLLGSVSADTYSYSDDLMDVYALLCDAHTQVEDLSGTTSSSSLPYTDNSPFQFITGYVLGAQSDQNITDSTCFPQAYQTKEFMDEIADSLYSIYSDVSSFDISDAVTYLDDLIVSFSNLVIQLSDQAVACQSELFIKQFATRTQSFSGLFNALFTGIYGVGYDFAAETFTWLPASSTQDNMNIAALNLYNDLTAYFSDGTLLDCQELGFNWGLMWSTFLTANIDTTVAFTEVQAFV